MIVTKNIIEDLINKMKFGDAVLFTGAGFSYGMENFHNESPKGALKLSELLLTALKQDSSFDLPLKDIVDYYILNDMIDDLIYILEDEYNIKNVCDYHELIAEINWKRCYTTNYDFGFELASKNVGKKIKSINPLSNFEENREGNMCIHINGDMNILNKNSLENEFALSDISYVNNKFSATYWFKLLQKDFENASAIVFIGYSLYDELIKKVLSSNKKFKEKTFIITSPKSNNGDLFKLGIYGNVLNIGTDGFAKEFNLKYKEEILPILNITTKFLTKYERDEVIETNDIEINKSDINNFFLFGKLSRSKIHKDYSNYLNGNKNYFIPREKYIMECVEKIKDKKNILIVGEIGNGKSVLLEQILYYLSVKEEFDLYTPDEFDNSTELGYHFDFDKINKKDRLSIILCDDINNNPKLISDFSLLNNSNIILVASVRSIEFDKINISEIKFDIINIDELASNEEIDYLIELVDILNFWNHDRLTLSKESKRKIISHNLNNQISEVLLDLFSSENIINKINDYLINVNSIPSQKNIIFLILLFKYLNIPIDNYIIKGILKDDTIDSLLFQSDTNIALFYSKDKTSGFTNKSSIFCRTTLKHLFLNDYKIKFFLNLVEIIEMEKNKRNSEVDSNILHLKDSLIKEIMRFSNVDNLLKERQEKKKSLFHYYDNLILKASWLSRESHYWLQLAMAKIANDKLDDAQKDLDAAYSMAKKKQILRDYSTSSIDTQQARLFIKKSFKENHNNVIWDYFIKAHSLLTSCENDKYRYRQVKEYEKFYNNKYSVLSKENKIKFKDCCIYMTKQINQLNPSEIGEYSIRNCEYTLNKIITALNDNKV